jgi:WD40 repeat protein
MWIGELPARVATISALAFAPHSRTLYSGDSQGYVLAWDLSGRTYRILFRRPFDRAHPGHRHVHWLWPTSDGRLLVQDQQRVIDALHPDAGPLFDPGPGEMGYFRYLFPDGRRAAKLDPDEDYRLDWWDLETGLRLPVPGPLGQATNIGWHTLLPDGVTLLTHACSRRTKRWGPQEYLHEVTLWDVRTGERVGNLTGPGLPPSTEGFVRWGPTLSADGRWLGFARDKTIWLYDVPSRSLRQQIETRKLNGVMAFHPNGRLLAAVLSDSQVALWDIVEKRPLERFDWKCGRLNALAFAPDGQTCALGALAKVVVWDVDL